MEYPTRPEITEDKVEQIRSIIIETPNGTNYSYGNAECNEHLLCILF